MCKTAHQKITALARVTPYMSMKEKKLLVSAFFESQFSYCPLAWMCCSKELNDKINRVHERCLHLIYNDKQSTFQELLEKDGTFTTHHRNIQYLAIEMFKVVKGLSPKVFSNLFFTRNQESYKLRQNSYFVVPKVNTVFIGTESISFIGPKIWNNIPQELKKIENLETFKSTIKKWKPEQCSCRLCKDYITGVGFL